MKLKETTINELGIILNEEYGKCLNNKELEDFAYSLVGYFDLLAKASQHDSSKIINSGLLTSKR